MEKFTFYCYYYMWFHEETLTSMEHFHCTNGSFRSLNILYNKKKMVCIGTVH